MTIKPFIKAIAALAVSGMMLNASANSAGIDAMEYTPDANGTITVVLSYDFTDFAMFGGGVDISYDTSALELMNYVQAPLQSDAQADASPLGMEGDGVYIGAGVGTFAFATGMSSAGEIGTFTFNVLGAGDPSSTDCGMSICLTANGINPFVSLAGVDVSGDVLGAGISGANVIVPVPAAVWFMLSGLGALIGFGRKSA